MAQQQQRYRILDRIAAGGMAEVYRAESAGLEGFKKVVAIKRVLPHLSEKKQFIGMFLDEARTSAHLSHSNCVQVFDIGVGDNTYFIVMEYVDGADLKAIIEHKKQVGQRISMEAASLICLRICEGLAYAHDATDHKGRMLGIVHRDMSPPNVLITRHGEVKIVDFGLAKANSQLERSEPGIIKGKFSYLSPEAALGGAVDLRTDVFAVGIMLWEMLAGRRLFLGETDLETVRQVQAAAVPPIRKFNSEVTPDVERVLAKALARDPTTRYQTAREFGQDLNDLLFRIGRPVSSFDIAALVRDAAAAREAEKRRKSEVDKVSIIGSLIDEAMVEFTSLDVGSSFQPATAGAKELGSAPLNLGSFEDVQDWAGELGGLDEPPGGAPARTDAYTAGNLAALEEDAPATALSASRRAPAPPSSPDGVSGLAAAAGPQAAVPAASRASAEGARDSGSGGALVAIVVLLVAAAGAAGAYFGGFLP